MTHFAVNAHLLSPVGGYRQAGVSGYIEHLLQPMFAATPADRWTIYATRGIDRDRLHTGPHTTLLTSSLPTTNPLVRIWWEQAIAPALLWRDRPAVLLCPLNIVPLLAPCPSVVTIHDLAFLRVPQHFHAAKRHYLAALTRRSVRLAAHILTVSQFTRREVIDLLGVPPEKVTAIPNGCDPPSRLPRAEEIAAFRGRHELPERFLLFVGTLEPRKNLLTLLRAYARLRDEIAMPLIIAGGKGWLYEPIFTLVEELGLRQQVRFVGFVSQEELPLWYSAATAFVYPSLYEGFGFPPLEAMHYGTPVVTSNTTSLPEVVGDAALTVDPTNVEELAQALLRITGDEELRTRLRARGKEQAARFSWQRTAHATLQVLRDTHKRGMEIPA